MRVDRSFLMAGVGAVALATGSAFAGVGAPDVSLTINGGTTSLTGTATSKDGVYNYGGTFADPVAGGWASAFDFNASAVSGLGTSFISGNFVITNNLGSAQDFEITLSLPVTASGSMMTLYGGSIAGSVLGDGDGGTFDTIGSDAVWTASSNGNFVAELLTAPISVTTGPFETMMVGSASFGEPIPSAAGPNLDSTLDITLRFSLGAGDSAAFTSVLVAEVVPAPGAIALLATAGLVSRRRRRN